MKRFITFLGSILLTVNYCIAYDHIIFRNGRETDVKLYQMTDDKIVFGYIGDNVGTQNEVSSKEVYMVYIEQQGNIYITPDGKHFTGETKRANAKKNDVIYLVRGAEIAAESIRITEDNIHYSVKSKESGIKGLFKKSEKAEAVLAKSEVFMIRYRSGMSDIITSVETQQETKNDTITNNQEAQYTVVFHSVAKGDNLQKISTKYNVTPEQIIDWNDLPKKTNPNSSLTIGMQLMIYQPKK